VRYLSRVEDYYSGKLKGRELKEFISELDTNPELKEEVLFYKRAIDFTFSQEEFLRKELKKIKDFDLDPEILEDIEKYGGSDAKDDKEKELLSLLKSENPENNNKKDKRRKIPLWFRYAASIIILVGLGITGIVFYPKHYTDDELFQKFYSAYYHHFNTRSFNTTQNIDLREGLNFYDNAQYEMAINKFKNIEDSLFFTDELYIVEGVCYIELRNFPDAVAQFKNVNSNSLVYDASLWYQGLCYLKEGDKEDAREVFKKLSEFEPDYPRNTKQLLKYLK